MLRPATPLSILLFAAFALLLISVLSTPIIKMIPLASFGGVDFGVLGWCKGSTCSAIEIGYDTSQINGLSATDNASFDLPSSTRTTLSAILIVHPIAALFTLIMLILAITAHFHKPSHSPRYLLGIFILSILTLILALLAFLIDVLLFVPHMAWGSYIVLAATVLIAASGIVSCAMRRTLVSRKARKKRIAENAEMSGENYYKREGRDPALPPAVPTTAMSSGGLGDSKVPTFATFTDVKDAGRTSDERIPLTARSPSATTQTLPPSSAGSRMGDPRYRGNSPPRDQYGNPMPGPPGQAYGMRNDQPLNRQYSDGSLGSRGRGGMPYRGRGGYGPQNGRGGYGPPTGSRGGPGSYRGGGYGPPGGRGGYGNGYGPPPPSRGGPMNDGMMRGGRGGGPPPGYGRGGNERAQSPYAQGARRPSQDGYQREISPRPPPTGEYAAYNPNHNPNQSISSLPRAESPPPLSGMDDQGPVGQAIEMDATTGSPSAAPQGFGQFGQLRDSDGDVAGMVGLQQAKATANKHDTTISDSSRYSTDEPAPPRQAWQEGRSSPLNPRAQAAELSNNSANHKRGASGDNYYEDVDPRFSDRPPPTNSLMPAALNTNNLGPIGGLDGNSSYEDVSGSRSPAESERSNFTSVSQRGVNPRWNPQQAYGQPMPRRPLQQQPRREDLLLNSNPDFQLPAGRGRAGQGRGGIGGMIPGSAYPGQSL